MKVGILGAGQLSRMLALAGIPLGLEFVFYDPKPSTCVINLGPQITAAYNDNSSLQHFLSQTDVITYENENIPLNTLEQLSQKKPVYPNYNALKIMQDRLLEKQFFKQLNIPTTNYFAINSYSELENLSTQLTFPIVVKKRREGYDGKGQVIIKNSDQLKNINPHLCQQAIVEEFVNYQREVSIIGCRDQHANTVFYDLCHNTHNHGILHQTENRPHDPLWQPACQHLNTIMQSLNYVGICTLEFFQVGKQLIANEMAPRVHNSGHWTIESTACSQFENHLRSIVDWPLGDPTSYHECIMFNILGKMPAHHELLKFQQAHLHDYCKAPIKGRKLGHVSTPQQFALPLAKTITQWQVLAD